MALAQYDETTVSRNLLRDTVNALRGYFVRYRFALYLFSGAVVAAGFALHQNWLATAGLLRIVLVLPCALMMFRCVRHGTRGSDKETKTLPEAGQGS